MLPTSRAVLAALSAGKNGAWGNWELGRYDRGSDRVWSMWRETAARALSTKNAKTAMWAIREKIALLRTVSDDRLPHHVAAAIAECCWWIVSLNDLIERELSESEKQHYRRQRGENPNGLCVVGAIWARNRQSHQLVVDVHEGDERSFASLGTEYVVFISKSLRWKRVDGMALRPKELEQGRWAQSAYESHFQERGVVAPLEAAEAWFRGMVAAEPG